MNAVKHCAISARRWGGLDSDYLAIHDFIDHTKGFCADSRHRILHTTWALNHIVVPIFGHTLTNSDGKSVNIKDMCERDHLLVDYHNRFIPTIADFVAAIDDNEIGKGFEKVIDRFHADYIDHPDISELLLSPLSYTGQLKALLITHNSWFLNSIVTRIFGTTPVISHFSLSPSQFMNAMSFELWMDNGMDFPSSAKKLQRNLIIPKAFGF